MGKHPLCRLPRWPHTVPQAAAAAVLAASPLSGAALAGEFDLLAEGTPTTYILDDAAVLNKTTKKSVGDQLKALEVGAGRRLAGCLLFGRLRSAAPRLRTVPHMDVCQAVRSSGSQAASVCT